MCPGNGTCNMDNNDNGVRGRSQRRFALQDGAHGMCGSVPELSGTGWIGRWPMWILRGRLERQTGVPDLIGLFRLSVRETRLQDL
jgi:hypothetical protein